MKKLSLSVLVVLSMLFGVAAVSADDTRPASRQACEDAILWWAAWARPMGARTVCVVDAEVPGVWAGAAWRGTVGGWAMGDGTNYIVSDMGDRDWMTFVIAHEYGHQWDTRVIQPYGMQPLIMQVMRWPFWMAEPWGDTFATCLGFRRDDITSYGRATLPTQAQCAELDRQGLLPQTSPRGFFTPGI